MFFPTPEHAEDLDFNWDVQGNNLFDLKAKIIFPSSSEIIVNEVCLTQFNDLRVSFSNQFVLECFVSHTTDEECWRLFRPGDKDGDFIVTS